MRDAIIIAIACVIAIAAGAWLFVSGSPGTSSVGKSEGPVTFSVISDGQNSGSITERKNFRIKDRAELDALWEMMYATDGPPLPPIDFESNEVLAVFDGTHSSGGYEVRVASITDGALSRSIVILRRSPGDTCVTTDALTSPYVLIVLPKTTLPIEREEVPEVVPCD